MKFTICSVILDSMLSNAKLFPFFLNLPKPFDLYFSKIESVKRNFELIVGYKLIDDHIFSEFLSKYI